MKLFPDIVFTDDQGVTLNDAMMKGNEIQEGWKVTFSSRDTQGLRDVLQAIYLANRHLDEDFKLLTMDEMILAGDDKAEHLMAGWPVGGQVCLIDMTCPIEYPKELLAKLDGWMSTKDKTIIVFERTHGFEAGGTKVQMPTPTGDKSNIRFVVNAHPHAWQQRLMSIVQETAPWPQVPGRMLLSIVQSQIKMIGAVQ